MKILLNEKNGKVIEINNDKGAIIIGPNGSGKSKIIERINNSAKKQKISIYNEENSYEIKHIDSSIFLKEDFESSKSGWKNLEKGIKEDIVKEIGSESFKELDSENIKKISERLLEINKNKKLDGINFSVNFECNNYNHEPIIDCNIILNGYKYDISSASTGTKMIINLLVNEIHSQENNTDNKILYLFDEIDAFLHPEWINLIANLLNRILEKNNIKMILITHNPLFISKLIKNNLKMISYIKRGNEENDGEVCSLDWDNIIEKTLHELQNKPTFFEKKIDYNIDKEYVLRYIISHLTPNVCKLFFDRKLLILEGMTEEIYFNNLKENVYSLINTGGFHQFPIIKFITDEINKIFDENSKKIIVKYIIDNDKGDSRKYNKHVCELLEEDNWFKWKKDFDIFISEKKIKNYEKIPNILEFISRNKELSENSKEENIDLELFLKNK